MSLFSDIEFVGIDETGSPDAIVVAFDAIYAGETWCRSFVYVDAAVVAEIEREGKTLTGAARDALLGQLIVEPAPVSLKVRLSVDGPSILARAVAGPRRSYPLT